MSTTSGLPSYPRMPLEGSLISGTANGGTSDDVTIIHPDAMGRYVIGVITVCPPRTNGIEFRIEAKEVSGFRDEQVTLMLMDGRTAEKAEANGGGIDDADPATVTVLSGQETPTVTFSTESIDIDEGDSETVHLLAGGMQGDEVGAVTVAVRGEALISLEQNGSPISGGTVSFGGNANAELTISRQFRSVAGGWRGEDRHGDDHGCQWRRYRRPERGDGDRRRLHRGSCAPAVRAVAPGLAPDGRRRAAVSAAPGIARRARRRGTVVGKGGPARMRRVPFFAFSRVFRVMAFPANSRLLPGGLAANGS